MVITGTFVIGLILLNFFSQITLYSHHKRYLAEKRSRIKLEMENKRKTINQFKPRIVYSQPKKDAILMGKLYVENKAQCYVAIIKHNAALVPASCLQERKNYNVIFEYTNKFSSGMPETKPYAVRDYHIHPGFNPTDKQFELALISLDNPDEFQYETIHLGLNPNTQLDYHVLFRFGDFNLISKINIFGLPDNRFSGTCFPKTSPHTKTCTMNHNNSFLRQFKYGAIDIVMMGDDPYLVGLAPPSEFINGIPFLNQISISPYYEWVEKKLTKSNTKSLL